MEGGFLGWYFYICDESKIGGFDEFYKHFFFELYAVEALEKYNSVITNTEDKLLIVSAEYTFDTITDIDRPTADKTRLKETYKKNLLKDYPDIAYFPKAYTDRYGDYMLYKFFNELKGKKLFFDERFNQ